MTERLHPPDGVVQIARTLEGAGYETWCVGGAIRDALLGQPHLDWDLATAASPSEVRRLFRRTVPVGIEFGTVGVLDRRGAMHEVTTFRRDVRTDGRHAEVEFGASLDEDLARRDFTINAIAWSPTREVLHDPFGGRTDLERRVVRAVGDPEARMREDRLRALRAIRFAARLDFAIDEGTWRAIIASAPHLTRLSRERVKQEIAKTMEQAARPSRAFALWHESGALAVLVPALASQPEIAFAALDCLPAPGSTAREERRSSRLLLRLAALFLGPEGGAVRAALKDLRFSNQQTAWIGHLAEAWRALGARMERALEAGVPDDAEVRRWAAVAGRAHAAALFRLAYARWGAAARRGGGAVDLGRARGVYRRLIRSAWRDPIAIGDLAVHGEDLRDAGFAPGPVVGKILRLLLERVVEDPSRNTRAWLLDEARRAAAEMR